MGGQAGQPLQVRSWADSLPLTPTTLLSLELHTRHSGANVIPPALRPKDEPWVVLQKVFSISRTPGLCSETGEQLFITNSDNKRTQAGFPAARRFRVDSKKDFQ